MLREVTVDFNTYPGPDLVHGNARHALPGVHIAVGAVVIVGDDDWGVVRAQITEFDPVTGSFTARMLGTLEHEAVQAVSA